MNIKKYRKNPVEVEAVKWDGSAEVASHIIDWILESDHHAELWCTTEPCSDSIEDHVIRIRTLEGDMDVQPGGYVIRGVQGEFYPCKSDIFAVTYEEVLEGEIVDD